MSNYLQYVLSLKDQMSASLKTIGITSSAALDKFAALEKQSKEASAIMKTFGGSIGSLKSKLDLLHQERDWIPASNMKAIKAYTVEIEKLEKEINKLEGTSKGGILKSIIGGNLISGAISNLASNAASGIGTILQSGMTAAKNKASLETLSGVSAGDKLFGDLTKFAQQSIFGNEVLDDAKMMRSFGIETEKIMPNLKMLGDISMGDKEKLGALTLAFSQSSAAGRLQGQDLLQMINAGFNPLNEISKKTGESMMQLRKRMEAGGVSFSEVQAAFESATAKGGMFYNMTQKIGDTSFGKWEAFKGQLQGIGMQIGTALMPAFSKLIDFLSAAADKTVSFFTGWWNSIKQGNPVIITLTILLISAVGSMILMQSWSLLVAGATAVWEGAQWLLNAALTANPIGIIIALIIAFAALIGYIIYKYNGWGDAWKALTSFLSNSWQMFKETFHFTWLTIVDVFMSGIELMEKGWYKFKSLWDEKGANEGLAKLNNQANERAKQLAESAGKIVEYRKMAAESWNKIGLTDSGKSVGDFKNAIKNKLGIASPKLPGGNDVKTNFSTTGGNTAAGSNSNNAVATGGTKNTTVHIQIGKQIESLTVMANNIQEGAAKIRDIIVDEMTRVIAMSQAIAE